MTNFGKDPNPNFRKDPKVILLVIIILSDS